MKKSPTLVSFLFAGFRQKTKKTKKHHMIPTALDKDVWFIPLNDTGYLPLKTYLGVILGEARSQGFSMVSMVFFPILNEEKSSKSQGRLGQLPWSWIIFRYSPPKKISLSNFLCSKSQGNFERSEIKLKC